MKIKRIEITNFRGIDHLELDFLHPGGNPLDLVALAGPNGCGKTSVLEACIIALGRSELLEDRKNSAYDIRKGFTDYLIKLSIEINGEDIIIVCNNSSGISLRKVNPSSGHKIEYLNLKLGKILIHYFSSWRKRFLVGPIQLTDTNLKKREDNRLRIIKQLLIFLSAKSKFKPESEELKRKEEEAYSKIQKAWNFFYPEKQELFEAKSPDDESMGFDLYLGDVPIDVLSSGEMEIFLMLSQFALNDYKNGIVFIDEPELHLHPAWHRIVLRVLKTVLPDTQIICATHSDEILDAVYSYERFTILPDDDPRIRMIQAGSTSGS